MNNAYGNLLPAMTPSINLGYGPYVGNNGYGHLSNLLDMGMPIHNSMSGLPGTLSTSPTSSPLTNSLPPIIHQQQQHQQQQQHHHHQQLHHPQQHSLHHQQQQYHHQQHQQQLHQPFSQQQQHHQPNQSQQQTPQPSPQHTSNSIPSMNQSLPSSDSIQSPPIYSSELAESLLNSSTNGNSNSTNNNSNTNTHIQNINITTLVTNTTNGSIGSPEEISSPKIKSKKSKSGSGSNGKSKTPKVLCSPLESSLNSLTKEQLVNLCSHFLQNNHPDLIQEFENLMPPPDLHEIMLDLDSLQKKYNKLFPSNEFSYDNTSYNRVKSGLAVFKKALIEYGDDFKEKNGWATLLQYVILALPYALRMPQWDDEKNNASRISALNKMDVFGKAAVKGLLQNDLSLEKWERHKNSLAPHTLYLKSTIEELDKCIDKRKKKEEKYEKTKKRKKIEK